MRLALPSLWHFSTRSLLTRQGVLFRRFRYVILLLAFLVIFFLLFGISDHLALWTYAKSADEHKLAGKRYHVSLATDVRDKNLHYGIMIDCGSSGSRVHVYYWPPHEGGTAELLRIRPMLDRFSEPVVKKVEPGLSSFVDKPEQASDYIKPLLTFAAKHIPKEKHRETPVYIMATAGMRVLTESQQDAILTDLRLDLRLQSDFVFSDSHVEVISGKQEGVYAWISINYAMGKLDHSLGDDPLVVVRLPGAGMRTHIRKRTLGVIDMGGASAQIAYEVPISTGIDKRLLAEFNLGCTDKNADHLYRVYVTTFLGYGGNAARRRYEDLLVRDGLTGAQPAGRHLTAALQHPGNSTDTLSAVSDPSAMTLVDPCLPLDMVDTITRQGVVYNLRGNGDFASCYARLRPLLNRTSGCTQPPCSMNGVYQPPIDFHNSEFYGFSEYFYTMEDVLRMAGPYDYSKFVKAAAEYCGTRWSTLQSWYRRHLFPMADRNRFRLQCFKSAWITMVLHEGFQFPKMYTKFTSAQKLKGRPVQWTTGALLYKTRYYPLREIEQRKPPSRYRGYQRPPWALPGTDGRWALVLCLVVVAGAILLYLCRLRLVPQPNLRRVPSMAYFMTEPSQPADGLRNIYP